MTRGPQPTGGLPMPGKPDAPGMPGMPPSEGENGSGQGWWDWVKDMFGNKGGNQE
jgi:hypothetical protein